MAPNNCSGSLRTKIVGMPLSCFLPGDIGMLKQELEEALRQGNAGGEDWRLRKDGTAILGQLFDHPVLRCA